VTDEKPDPHLYVDYAKRYLRAAKLLPPAADFMPRFQLCGHALELAMKAFLAAKDRKVPRSHDLERLLGDACSAGLTLDHDDRDRGIVDILNAIYKGLPDWDFPARYPKAAPHVWLTPSPKQVVSLIASIIDSCEAACAASGRKSRRPRTGRRSR
jgi:HEPN domain-containing protein